MAMFSGTSGDDDLTGTADGEQFDTRTLARTARSHTRDDERVGLAARSH